MSSRIGAAIMTVNPDAFVSALAWCHVRPFSSYLIDSDSISATLQQGMKVLDLVVFPKVLKHLVD